VQQYLAASYYERWFAAITTLLVEKGVATAAEVEAPDDHAH
jgi:nitrile hydratase